ncbi:polymerase [Drepanopeziza brunnea f. sp. 'multigermtubi' MB_m1]|uniref:Polymerase n=1 Tax=Marssonina brunnea f. sp. multigermtubi (strain MB_m1) TaxID=1072389 RepID=K1WGF9_MARBU|nr:polymerase [Drepanopeziza brunnea f. sp. 'multigermtubi' MB_m1]EKD11956.1 polymerase [Drepanopeziza brunnea f. sp. 'multigermtubi' MB_m1]
MNPRAPVSSFNNSRPASKILRTPFKAALAAPSSSSTAQPAVPSTQEEATTTPFTYRTANPRRLFADDDEPPSLYKPTNPRILAKFNTFRASSLASQGRARIERIFNLEQKLLDGDFYFVFSKLAATAEIKDEDRLRFTTLYKPSIIPNSQRAFTIELVTNPARPKEQRSSASADRSNRSNKFSFLGNAPKSTIKTLGSSRKDSNTPKLPRYYSVNEIEYGARLEYGLYSDDSDDRPYSDALKDHQELPFADSDAPDNKRNLRDMRYLDLTKLLDSKAMTIPVTLTKNSLSYKVSALLDSRANNSRADQVVIIVAESPPSLQNRPLSLRNRPPSASSSKIVEPLSSIHLFINPLTRFINGSIFAIDFAAELSKLINDPLIPLEYFDYIHVFFKAASNVLAPYRPYDYKIELFEKEEKALRYSLLYKISILELKLTKAYLIDNLNKGFIEPLTAPFAALVLFAKKQDGSFRFYIDFRALNNLTRKDRYLLFLIDKTLARLLRAKIFTKLDIRQAFYKIRMDPALKELTTFKIRYDAYKCKVLLFGLINRPATY